MPRQLRDCGEGRRGHRWVDVNFDVKLDLEKSNGNVLPFTPAFTTSAFPGSDEWSEDNLPEILLYLNPPKSRYEGHSLQPLLDDEGRTIMSPTKPKQELHNLPCLPDRISVDVPGWMIVAWRRVDPRIQLHDISDRMTTDLGEAQKFTSHTVVVPSNNIIQNNCSRDCRKLLKYYNDYAKRNEPHRAEVEAVENLTYNNIRFNTVLDYSSKFNRLVKIKFIRKKKDGMIHVQNMEVTAENLAETTYPVDYFLFAGYQPQFPNSMAQALKTLWMVQERAMIHGLDASEWGKLGRSCLPPSWFDRTIKKTAPNDTYDGGCDVCTWKPPANYHWDDMVDWMGWEAELEQFDVEDMDECEANEEGTENAEDADSVDDDDEDEDDTEDSKASEDSEDSEADTKDDASQTRADVYAETASLEGKKRVASTSLSQPPKRVAPSKPKDESSEEKSTDHLWKINPTESNTKINNHLDTIFEFGKELPRNSLRLLSPFQYQARRPIDEFPRERFAPKNPIVDQSLLPAQSYQPPSGTDTTTEINAAADDQDTVDDVTGDATNNPSQDPEKSFTELLNDDSIDPPEDADSEIDLQPAAGESINFDDPEIAAFMAWSNIN